MNLTPEMLIEQTYNYYGLKTNYAKAIEFISLAVGAATPGSFVDWLKRNKLS